MNAVEIEEAVSALASSPFDAGEFPYAFLAAFGNKETTIKRLRSGSSNSSDIPGGVLQRSNIHMAVCALGEVGGTLAALRLSPKTSAAKAKFVLATDGVELEAEDLASGDTIACDYGDFADHFGFFLPLAGISGIRTSRSLLGVFFRFASNFAPSAGARIVARRLRPPSARRKDGSG